MAEVVYIAAAKTLSPFSRTPSQDKSNKQTSRTREIPKCYKTTHPLMESMQLPIRWHELSELIPQYGIEVLTRQHNC
jgi:hypothetical protein